MNASTNDTVSTEVRDYVAGVRAALSDLTVEDVEEFTTGMEADLAERLAEQGEGTLRDRLGDPDAYAAELRSAAGLPPRVPVAPARTSAAEQLSTWWTGVSRSVLGQVPWLRDLRPVWWAVRGFALAAAPALVLGVPIIWLGLLGAMVSIALGLMARHGRLSGGWVGPVRVMGNITAVLLLPVALVMVVDAPDPYANDPTWAEPQYSSGAGLTYDGEPVANVYAYDESGRRIDKVRLLDQNGRPLKVSEDALTSADDMGDVDLMRDSRTGELDIARDVFPLRWNGRTGWERMYDREWEPPMAITPLPGPVPSVEASPTPSPSATPQATQTSPGAGATATPTPTPTTSVSR